MLCTNQSPLAACDRGIGGLLVVSDAWGRGSGGWGLAPPDHVRPSHVGERARHVGVVRPAGLRRVTWPTHSRVARARGQRKRRWVTKRGFLEFLFPGRLCRCWFVARRGCGWRVGVLTRWHRRIKRINCTRVNSTQVPWIYIEQLEENGNSLRGGRKPKPGVVDTSFWPCPSLSRATGTTNAGSPRSRAASTNLASTSPLLCFSSRYAGLPHPNRTLASRVVTGGSWRPAVLRAVGSASAGWLVPLSSLPCRRAGCRERRQVGGSGTVRR
jgi:hypothetical protein